MNGVVVQIFGPRIEALLLEDPFSLRTPIVRRGQDATFGFCPETWETWETCR